MNPLRTAWQLSLAGTLLVASACSQILSIEDAQLDRSLSPTPSAGAAGTTSGVIGPLTQSQGGQSDNASGGQDSGIHMHTGGDGNSSGKTSVGSQSSGGTEAGSGELDLCERYCDQVTRNCKGKYEQYRTFDQCVQVCKRLPPGQAGDEDTNTVSCRLRQAEFADSEPFVYCKSAGPLGAGKCGSNCVSYCSLMQEACTAESTRGNLELSYYASSQACLSACGALPASSQAPVQYSSSASAEPTSFVGNTVFCRTYHVAAALEQNAPDEHCPHAMGGDPCIDQ